MPPTTAVIRVAPDSAKGPSSLDGECQRQTAPRQLASASCAATGSSMAVAAPSNSVPVTTTTTTTAADGADNNNTNSTTATTTAATAQPESEEFTFRPAYFFFYNSLMDPDLLSRVLRLQQPPVYKPASLHGHAMKLWAGEYPVLVPRSRPPITTATTTSPSISAPEPAQQVLSLTRSVSLAGRRQHHHHRRAKSRGTQQQEEEEEEEVDDESDDGEGGAGERRRIRGRVWLATDMEQALRLQEYETSAYIACDCRVRLDDGSGDQVRAVTFCWAGDPEDPVLKEGEFELAAWQRDVKPGLLGFGVEGGGGT